MSDEPPTAPAEWGEERSREITWHDPAVGALGRSGAGRAGLPVRHDRGPAAAPTDRPDPRVHARRIADGEASFTCEPHESHYNPIGMVHGGLVCTLLDSALGCAVHTQLPAGVGYTSIEIKVSYLRAVTPASGTLTAHAQVTKPGRRVAFADGDVRDAAGAIIATASGSCLIIGG